MATIVFSHANSFPAGTYRLLFDAWRNAGYTVHAVEKYGHDPRYPVTNHWPKLRDQLLRLIDKKATEPVFLVGHSLGGYLSLLAAAKRPAIARGVVMLDSPVIGGLLTSTIQFAKLTGLGKRFSPGHISQKRRHHWTTSEAAHTHFAKKAAFARWDEQVLRDYIYTGIEAAKPPMRKGVTLSFDRDVETQIYHTIPDDIAAFLRRYPLKCPLAFIGGTESVEVRQVGLGATEKLAEGRVSWMEGTHLFPFEKPQATAAEVLRWLDLLGKLPA